MQQSALTLSSLGGRLSTTDCSYEVVTDTPSDKTNVAIVKLVFNKKQDKAKYSRKQRTYIHTYIRTYMRTYAVGACHERVDTRGRLRLITSDCDQVLSNSGQITGDSSDGGHLTLQLADYLAATTCVESSDMPIVRESPGLFMN